jgi:hypothetical protein
VLLLGGIISGVLATPQVLLADGRQTAAGWLQLERDQQRYRERVAPLDLREQRQLEIIERTQRNDLDAAQQRLRRSEQLERGRRLLTPPPRVPRRDTGAERRRTIERLRLDLQLQQQRLPYGAGRR